MLPLLPVSGSTWPEGQCPILRRVGDPTAMVDARRCYVPPMSQRGRVQMHDLLKALLRLGAATGNFKLPDLLPVPD